MGNTLKGLNLDFSVKLRPSVGHLEKLEILFGTPQRLPDVLEEYLLESHLGANNRRSDRAFLRLRIPKTGQDVELSVNFKCPTGLGYVHQKFVLIVGKLSAAKEIISSLEVTPVGNAHLRTLLYPIQGQATHRVLYTEYQLGANLVQAVKVEATSEEALIECCELLLDRLDGAAVLDEVSDYIFRKLQS